MSEIDDPSYQLEDVPEEGDHAADPMLPLQPQSGIPSNQSNNSLPFLQDGRAQTMRRLSTGGGSMGSKISLELYPERGSKIAIKMGSIADMKPIARKMYILTQVLAAISVSIGSMGVGFSAGYTSPAIPSLKADNSTFSITVEEESWIGSLMPLSAIVGSIVGGYIIGALGRKMVILLCGPPFVVAWVLIGSAVNIWMIYVGRSISGFCVGLLTLTLPVYLSETIQPEIRGVLGLLPTTLGNGGILVAYTFGYLMDWSWLAYAGAVIPVVFTGMMCFVPETPRWYISKGRPIEARSALEWLRGSDADVETELSAIEENFETSKREMSSLKDLMNRRLLRPLFNSFMLMLFQQLSGINAVIFYSASIFELAGTSLSKFLCSIILGIVNLFATLIANSVIDRIGRKPLLYISSSLMVMSLAGLGTYFYYQEQSQQSKNPEEWGPFLSNMGWLPLVSLMLYVLAFSLGWGPIPWLFMGEVLPARVRGPAASFVTCFNWSFSFIITKTFPGMVKQMGPCAVFFTFMCIMVVSLLFTILIIPETKGKSLEEIEREMSGKKAEVNNEL
ncbi:unnamed protein product [Meganyctiphanes norvegica]|uniref:Major facilitator superfamily (MFS) profile domain-containing protein n=1 Tax=Meganyctiphanes norvegica TaxID=48144 RepID=A0AAV2RX29_MEGNR